jgi:hypothetical protein
MQYIRELYLPRISNVPGMTRYVALLEVVVRRYSNFVTGREPPEDTLKNPARDLDAQSTGNFGRDL